MTFQGRVVEEGLRGFGLDRRVHGGHVTPRIWVIVADGRDAYIYRKTPEGIEKIAEAKSSGKKPEAVGVQKNTGHAVGAGGSVHYASDPRDRENHHDDAHFAQDIAAWLDKAVREDAFDRLVLAAAPRTLGALRKALSESVHARVVAEVDRDFTAKSSGELQEELQKILWF